MSKIKDLLKSNEAILVFDVDGVLALLEYGDYNHYIENIDVWFNECANGINHYTEDKVISRMQDFIKNKDTSKIYVITLVVHENELEFKKDFLNKYYNIPRENVYCVYENQRKKEILYKIKEKYPDIENFKIVMIDDTTDVLNDVKENTPFSTVHVSSFLDI